MVRVRTIRVGAYPSRLPCDRIVIEIQLAEPITKSKELDEFGIDFYDRAPALTPEELVELLKKLGVMK